MQEPMLRTVCNRVAFQEGSNDMVRVSLDTNLHMVHELDAPRALGDWCRGERRAPPSPCKILNRLPGLPL